MYFGPGLHWGRSTCADRVFTPAVLPARSPREAGPMSRNVWRTTRSQFLSGGRGGCRGSGPAVMPMPFARGTVVPRWMTRNCQTSGAADPSYLAKPDWW